MIILSFGGTEDVSIGKFDCFQLLDAKDSILVEKGIESCCLDSKGIDHC